MRIAVLIIGLVLGAVILVQSFSVGVLSEIGNNEKNADAGAAGLWVAILWIIGSALAIAFPMASVVLFLLASALAFSVAGSTDYADMWVWGSFGIALAVFSFFGWRGKVRDRRNAQAERQRQLERDDRLEQLLVARDASVAGESPSGFVTCPSCGYENALGTKFCPECGNGLHVAQLKGQPGRPPRDRVARFKKNA